MYVPNKTVNRGNFSKYINRVYTIIRDSRVNNYNDILDFLQNLYFVFRKELCFKEGRENAL